MFPPRSATLAAIRCSFCNEPQDDRRKVIAGPAVFICEECIHVCSEILAEERRSSEERALDGGTPIPPGDAPDVTVVCALCRSVVRAPDAVPVESRGVVCLGCAGEVEAAIERRRASGPG